MISALLPLMQIAAPAVSAADDIVVTAVRDACTVRFAERTMTDAEFDARAAEWKAGRPVRVISRASADLACVRRIASRLFARGVTRIEFVDPEGRPSFPFDPPAGLPHYGAPVPAGGGDHATISRDAAQMILHGRCDDARKLVLERGDLDAAAAVATICRTPGR